MLNAKVRDVKLKSVERKEVEGTASAFDIAYSCNANTTKIKISTKQEIKAQTAFVLPIISPSSEVVKVISANEITIKKPKGLVTIKANAPIKTKAIAGKRTFNMVPGVEALPLEVFFQDGNAVLELSITVS